MVNKRTKASMTESEDDKVFIPAFSTSTKKINSSKKASPSKKNNSKVKKEEFNESKKEDRDVIFAAAAFSSKEHKTPKCQTLKREALTEKRQTKKQQRNISEGCESEENDPFNFDLKKDELPIFIIPVNTKRLRYDEEIKNIINTPNHKSKMGNEERQSVSAPLPQTPKTSAANKAGRKTPIATKRKASEDAETPAKLAKVDAQISVKKALPNVEDEIPVLNAEEQVAADNESNTFYPRGARVFAIFGKDYYPAIVDESDGLGRYKIFFTEDHSRRTVPRDGVFPLHYVKENYAVMVIGEEDEQGERPVYHGKISSVPSLKNVEEWHRGIFTIEVHNEEHPEPESREIEWVNIYFTEAQYKQQIKSAINAINQENGFGGRRRSRHTSALPVTNLPKATPASNAKKNGNIAKPEEEEEAKSSSEPNNTVPNPGTSSANRSPFKIFDSLQFILTSANRESGPRPFAKRDVRKQIESRGGNVVETFESMNPDLTTYLIADTFYRTHKYLTALSLSVPTVSFKWINKCVEENKLVDYNDFMLDAGESETTGEVYKWQPLKGKILGGKKVAIYSKRAIFPSNNPVDFRQIWAPIIYNLGAELVDNYPSDKDKAIEFFKKKNIIDYFVADDGATPQELINAVLEGGAVAVTSEWVIQTVITGIIGTTSGDESYVLHPK